VGTIWLKEFLGGLDTRRMPETTPGGVLIQAFDGHITRGGEFESRAAFVKEYDLPAGTIGLAYTRTGLVVFGSTDEPTGIPAGVTYQKLTHPDGADLVSVPSFDLYSGKLYVVGVFSDGSRVHFYDGVEVEDWFDGRARATFQIIGGTGSSQLTDLTIGGVAAIGSAVTWTTSNSNTAQLIADEVNSAVSDPEYTAIAVDDVVVLTATVAAASDNGKPVVLTVASGLVTDPASGIVLSGGVDAADTFQPGIFVRTIGSKMYSLSGSNMHFSGIQAPTGWTTDNVGAGFVDMASYASGAEELKALANYQGQVAVYAETNIQIWYTDPDPALNRQTQVLNNTGTIAAGSVTQFGDSDLFYLDLSGLRSLRARDASNAAATTDIGSAVDSLIIEAIESLTEVELEQVVGLIEPRDGRFWLAMKDLIFVFTYFSGAKVSAWSIYRTTDSDGLAFNVEQAVVFGRRVCLRGGNSIYVYGGLDGALVYDATEAVAQTPYLDADRPSVKKAMTGIDVALSGEWTIYAAQEPTNLAARDKLGVFSETTFNQDRAPALGKSTHLSIIFKSTGTGPHNLASCVIHHDLDDAED